MSIARKFCGVHLSASIPEEKKKKRGGGGRERKRKRKKKTFLKRKRRRKGGEAVWGRHSLMEVLHAKKAGSL